MIVESRRIKFDREKWEKLINSRDHSEEVREELRKLLDCYEERVREYGAAVIKRAKRARSLLSSREE
jgi:hypothetical protein